MALTAGILLAVYIIAIALVIVWPTHRRHPEDGMAIGCLMLVAIACALLGGVLFLAAHFHLRWLVYIIFAMTLYPALYLIPNFAYAGWKKLKARSAARGRRLLGEDLVQVLTSQTHVFHRNVLDPKREYDELKFYSPDGKLICYERENGALKQLNLDAAWSIKDDLLRTTGQYGPGTANSFTLYQTQGGHIAYYIHEPFSTLNNKLSGMTWQVLAADPRQDLLGRSNASDPGATKEMPGSGNADDSTATS